MRKREQKIRKKPVESTQMQIPIREILRTGTIITDDKRFIRIIEVKAGPFLLSTADEQELIIARFANMLKLGPQRIQIIGITMPGDLSQQIEYIRESIATEKNASVQSMGREFLENLENEQRHSVKRRYFVVFEMERSSSQAFRKMNIDEVENTLNAMEDQIISELISCGNDVSRSENRYQETLEILYTFFNRDRSVETRFEEHMADVIYKYYRHYGETAYYIPPVEFFAPDSMHFVSYDRVKINDTYYSYLYIPSDGYPSQVQSGWLTPFLNIVPGIDVTVHLRKIPETRIMGKIRRSIIMGRVAVDESSDISDAYDSAMSSVAAGVYLKNGIQNYQQNLFYMTILLTISGSTPEIVEKKVEAVKRLASKKELTLFEATFEEEQMLYSTIPLNYLDDRIYRKTRQNMLTLDVAATYPLTAAEFNETGGVFLGTDLTNRSLVVLDPFSPRLTNPHYFLCGTSGAGKTFALLLMAMRMRLVHIPVFIIAPEKEHEFMRVCKAMGGQFITIAMGSHETINIMEIRKQNRGDVKLLDGSYGELSQLDEKIDSCKVFIKLLVQDITIEEQQLVDDALYRTYARFGITRDNDSLWADETHTGYKKMPILSDLREELKGNPRATRIYNILGILTDGSGRSFNGQTNVSLDNDFTVISTEHLKGDMMPLGIYLAFDFLMSKVKENRILKKALFIDEFWKMNAAADQMLEAAKTFRGYSCSMLLATQQMKDIMKVDNGIYGEGILNNCATKILLRMEKNDTDNVQQIVGLQDEEKEMLENAVQGNALIISGKTHISLHFDAYDTEYRLITTKGEDLQKMIDEVKDRQEEESKTSTDSLPEGYKVVDGMLVKVVSGRGVQYNAPENLETDFSSFKRNTRLPKEEQEALFTEKDILDLEEFERRKRAERAFTLEDIVPVNDRDRELLKMLAGKGAEIRNKDSAQRKKDR